MRYGIHIHEGLSLRGHYCDETFDDFQAAMRRAYELVKEHIEGMVIDEYESEGGDEVCPDESDDGEVWVCICNKDNRVIKHLYTVKLEAVEL